jgi:probable rRNA maturation factor
MGKVQFFTEGISFKLPSPRKTKAWIEKVTSIEGSAIDSITYVFCSDSYLADINYLYLKHKSLTDIVTFDYSEDNLISGEVYISIDRVKENAVKFQQTVDNELHRVIIHGILHLLGYKDKSPSQKTAMRKKEDTYLSLRSLPVKRST